MTNSDDGLSEWTIDGLAGIVGLPVRTVREYQSLGILSPPRRRGRVGWYGTHHLRRLELIARLRERGHSLAGIGDLLGNWGAGADLGEVLGLEPDELIHVDEPGAPATKDQLEALLPEMVPEHLDSLVDSGVIQRSGPDGYCIPSPSLLQLIIEARRAGLAVEEVIALLGAIRSAADTVTAAVVNSLSNLPAHADVDSIAAFMRRSRGLLGHGVGRLTLHRIGHRLGLTDEDDLAPAVRRTRDQRGAGS